MWQEDSDSLPHAIKVNFLHDLWYLGTQLQLAEFSIWYFFYLLYCCHFYFLIFSLVPVQQRVKVSAPIFLFLFWRTVCVWPHYRYIWVQGVYLGTLCTSWFTIVLHGEAWHILGSFQSLLFDICVCPQFIHIIVAWTLSLCIEHKWRNKLQSQARDTVAFTANYNFFAEA